MTAPADDERDAMPSRSRRRSATMPVDISAATVRIDEALRAQWPKILLTLDFYQEYRKPKNKVTREGPTIQSARNNYAPEPARTQTAWTQAERDNVNVDKAALFTEISGALLEALMREVAESEAPKVRGRPRKLYLDFLGPRLGAVFRGASGQQVTRNRVYSTRRQRRPIDYEYGTFKDGFLKLVLPALEKVRRDYAHGPKIGVR